MPHTGYVMESSYMKYLILVVLVVVGFLAIAKLPHPIRKYTVRENIVNTGATYSFELWCWTDLTNNKVTKKYIGSFKVNGQILGDPIDTTLCSM
jgi:hypothetical protein